TAVEAVRAHKDPRVPSGRLEPERDPRLRALGNSAHTFAKAATVHVEGPRTLKIGAVDVDVEDPRALEGFGHRAVLADPDLDRLLTDVPRAVGRLHGQ